jgi:hypothetical protein
MMQHVLTSGDDTRQPGLSASACQAATCADSIHFYCRHMMTGSSGISCLQAAAAGLKKHFPT